MIEMNKKRILVTVGTTEFQSLVKYVDSEEFINLLEEVDRGKTRISQKGNNINGKLSFRSFEMLLQIGAKAQYEPKFFDFIRLSDRISSIYHESDLIISHGGAGTLLQNLRDNKKMIAVANNTLAGNHQVELIHKLCEEGYLLGFESVDDMKKNTQKIKDFLQDKIKFKEYEKVTKSVLNDIIFGDD